MVFSSYESSKNQSPEKANPASESPSAPVQGDYTYTSADGQKHPVRYTADNDGYASTNAYQSTHYSRMNLLKSFAIDN